MMRLDGIHHITAITGDAQGNLDFYAGLLGLRFVKKTVNFDVPDVYHLYYGDELGNPGSILTFFEYPGIERGRAGAGMIYSICWRVGSQESIDFWAGRLAAAGVDCDASVGRLTFSDPEGLRLEMIVTGTPDPALTADSPDVPTANVLLGFQGVRAYSDDPARSRPLLTETLGFEEVERNDYLVQGSTRSSSYVYDPPPQEPGLQGGGSVHHIAWAAEADDHESWLQRVRQAGVRPTDIIDRQYFRSIYFHEPSGVLFEIATKGPGFTIDEPAEQLGANLTLPPQHEHLRARLEQTLTPIRVPNREQISG